MEALGIQWVVEKRNVADLKNWDKNPRKITEEAYERLRRKIVEEGMHQVLTIDTDNTVLSGNQRLRILQELQIVEAWCMVPARALTAEERDKVGIQSNIIEGNWDFDMLANQFDIPVLLEQGITKMQLGMNKPEEDDFDAEKEAEGITQPVAQMGDVYQIGRHRLMCGDSTKREMLEVLMNGEKANMIWTDPPYNVNYSYAKYEAIHGGRKKKFMNAGKIFNDNKDEESFYHFLLDVFRNLYEFTTDDAAFYCCFATKSQIPFMAAYRDAGFLFSQTIIWLKERIILAMGQDYHRIYEPILFGWKEGNKHYANRLITTESEFWTLDRQTFEEQLDVWYMARDKSNDYIHPTQKPVRLPERALRKSSKPGDLLFEPFNGSSSLMVACEQTDRRCYSMELDPKYVDVAIRRMKKLRPDIHIECLNRQVDMAQLLGVTAPGVQ